MVMKMWRLKKILDTTWQRIDTLTTSVHLKKMSHTRKSETSIYPIPGEQHFAIPMGTHPREYSISFTWDEGVQCMASTATFGDTLKLWDCAPLYYIELRDTSMYNDVFPREQYVVCKQLTLERKVPGISNVAIRDENNRMYKKWDVTMDIMTAPSQSMDICPAFEIPIGYGMPTLRTDGVNALRLENVADATEYIEARLISIVYKQQAKALEFPIPGEQPLVILPMLGNTGPVVDIEFNTTTDEEFIRIQRWVTGYLGDTVVKVAKTAYEEFDDDQGDTVNDKNSKWIISSIQVTRGVASGGAFNPALETGLELQQNHRNIRMTLTRYWKWELMNGGA